MSKCRIHGSVCNNEFLDRGGDCIRTRSRKYEGPFKECLYEELSILDKQLRGTEAENRWILVSERLPETDGEYLVCDAGCRTQPLYVVSWFDTGRGSFNYTSATHWKPIILPEE